MSKWDTSKVTALKSTFSSAGSFNGDVSKWDTSKVTTLHRTFNSAGSFNGNVSKWDTSKVTTFYQTFYYAGLFNGDVSKWDTSKVTTLETTFYSADSFNGDVSKWNTSKVKTFKQTFYSAGSFNGDVSKWDTPKVTLLWATFSSAGLFNGDVSKWDTSKVTSLYAMFSSARSFNGDVSKWDTSKVTSLRAMFHSARSFNGDVSKWDISEVTSLQSTFYNAASFNGDVSKWDTSKVTSLDSTFSIAGSFNGDVSKWNISKVKYRGNMFWGARTQNFCPAGTFGRNKALRFECNKCPAGKFSTSPGMTTISTCNECTVGRVSNATGLGRACPQCAPGMFQEKSGRSQCETCPAGYFQPKKGSDACQPCYQGLYSASANTSNCKSCKAGMFQENIGRLQCKACPAGYSQSQKGSSSCLTCFPGLYSAHAGALICKRCEAGKFQPSYNTRSCIYAPRGYFVVLSKTFVMPCPVGKYAPSNASADEACRRCPLGFFQDKVISTACEMVTAGHQTLTDEEGATQQIQCPPGMFSEDRATGCKDCPHGKFQRDYGRGSCDKCPQGKTTLFTGARECTDVRPDNKHVSITKVHREGNAAIVTWSQKEEVIHKQIIYSIRTAGNTTTNASTVSVGATSAKAVGLLYGLKYYFSVSARLSEAPNIAISLPSDPITIPCPAFACCGVEEDPKCGNVTYGVTEERMAAQKDAYRVKGIAFGRCPQAGACLGGSRSECASGYTGMLCHRCRSGFARSGVNACGACDAWTVAFIIIGILVSAAMCVYFIKSTLANKESTQEVEMGKIALSGLQALTVLGRYPLEWPSEISAIFDTMGAMFSATGEVVSFQCAMDDADGSRYLRGAGVLLGAPIAAVCAAGIFWTIVQFRGGHKKHVRSNFIVSVMVILFLVLPTLNQTTFRMLTCTAITPDTLRVSGDLNLPCYEGSHLAYVLGIALPSLLIYSIGIPTIALYILRRMHLQKKLFAPRELSYSSNVYRFLYGGYKIEAYFWEAVIMLRKVSLNVVLVVMAPSPPLAQALTVLLVLIIFLGFHIRVRPYNNDRLNNIEMGSLLLSGSVLYAGIYLFNDDVRRDVGIPITICMVGALLFAAVAFVLNLLWFSKNEHADEISAAKEKASHKLQDLGERAFQRLELASQRIRSASTSSNKMDSVNPMHSV